MSTISKKTKWVATSGWRGYEEYVNAVAGVNDTGTYDDSPCPSSVRKAEIAMAKAALRKAGIRHRTAWGNSSNCFMMRQQVLVAPEDRAKAIEILLPLRDETQLLWVNKI
jgi:hypothetical protein